MKIGKIDKDLENIIYYLDDNGFRPYSSCDGVEANHQNPKSVNYAYVAFLKSPKITNLMSAFLKDKDKFCIYIESENHLKPYESWGNIISGNTYNVSFKNNTGENTKNFENIIKDVIEEKGNISVEDKIKLDTLDKVLEETSDCDLCFKICLNGYYAPYMKRNEKINFLEVSTKIGEERREGNISIHTERDMNVLSDILSDKYNLPKKIDDFNEKYIETEFVMPSYDKSSCFIYFTDEHFTQILEQIQYIKQVAHTLPTFEGREWVGSDEDLFNEIYDNDIWDLEDDSYTINEDEFYGKQEETPLEQREKELNRLEKEEKQIKELEQMINKYSSKGDNTIGE